MARKKRNEEKLWILDFGSQYTQLIARAVREFGVHSEIVSHKTRAKDLPSEVRALIFSGSPSSVLSPNALEFDEELLECALPILGICYGLQAIVHKMGGDISKGESGEFGAGKLRHHEKSHPLFHQISEDCPVWMSHGDSVSKLPEEFSLLAESRDGLIAAVAHREKKILGLQFHPEVSHTEDNQQFIKNFLFDFAKLKGDWSLGDFLELEKKKLEKIIGHGQAICALSGGVDSTVAAALTHKAIGNRLHCIYVNHGLARKEDSSHIEKLQQNIGLSIRIVDASQEFLSALQGVSDPEEKRKIIGKTFIDVFEREKKELEKTQGKIEFLVQGTLYPDVIESVSPYQDKVSSTIKSHHNVGGLPENFDFTLIEPLRELFKDEVRELGGLLEVPDDILKRHPFPGPGLAIRIIGEINEERLDLLREVDAVYIEELKRSGHYDQIWQALAVWLPIQSVGVKGDERAYEHVIALRAVISRDGMTADWYRFPHDLLAKISNRITNEFPKVGRVVYDVSTKPPATIEWE
jgi:GMP synthase (glutamine-hydrolysing)